MAVTLSVACFARHVSTWAPGQRMPPSAR
jgi:hypothetical protein